MRQTRVKVAGIVAATVAAVAMAACGGGRSGSADLGRELDAATGDSMSLLPNRGGTQVVSAIERTPGSGPVAGATVKRPHPAHSAVPEPVPAPVVAKAPAQVVQAPVIAPTPTPTPTPTPRRAGGYSTMGDIMRKAPFPINPVTTARKPH